MQLLVDGKLHKTTLESPGITLALNVLPLNKTLAEAATLRYVQNTLREGFNGHVNSVHHRQLVTALEPIGGLAKMTPGELEMFPGAIALNAQPRNWKYECHADLLGIMIDSFITQLVFKCVRGSVFHDKFEHETIFNVQRQTEDRVQHVVDALRSTMNLIDGPECSFGPGEVDEDGYVTLHYSAVYGEYWMYGPGPHSRGRLPREHREKINSWMKLNFAEHEIHGRPLAEVSRLLAAQQWLPVIEI